MYNRGNAIIKTYCAKVISLSMITKLSKISKDAINIPASITYLALFEWFFEVRKITKKTSENEMPTISKAITVFNL